MNKSGHINKFTSIILCALSCIFILSQSIIAAEKKTNTAADLKVEIVSPREGERVHGNIMIEARVNYPEAVEYCAFYIQEPGAKDRYGWQDYSPPYFWGGDGQKLDSTMVDDGSASVVAFCFPKDNKSLKFEKRVRFIIDNGKPKIKIMFPEDQAILKEQTVIRSAATDSKGLKSKPGITAIYIYIDGSLFQKLTKPSYDSSIATCMFRPGLHHIRAVAEDSEGLTNYDTIIVNVLPDDSLFEPEKKTED